MTKKSSQTNSILFFDNMCLSHFARADRLDDLHDLLMGTECWTTQVVMEELRFGSTEYPALANALELDWIDVVRFEKHTELTCFRTWIERLGAGERDLGEASVFAAAQLRGGIAITDDRDAVKVAQRYRIEVHGTIWLLAVACRNDTLTEVAVGSLIDDLRATGHRLPCRGLDFPQYARENRLL